MKARIWVLAGAGLAAATLAAGAHAGSNQDAGKAEGRCRDGEQGPAVLVEADGLKDRRGLLKLEVYPSNDEDFLGDDSGLLRAGKVFRRVEVPVPADGPVQLCVRVPGPGAYSLVLMHDRDGNHKFSWWDDGVGFPGNPKLAWHKPRADQTRLYAGAGLTRVAIVLNYRHGLGMGPVREKD